MSEKTHRYPLRVCPLCGSRARDLVHSAKFAQLAPEFVLPGYDVVICGRCGLGYADHIPPHEVFEQYYRCLSKYEAPSSTQPFLAAWTSDRLRTVADQLCGVLPDRKTRILDVGSATGELLAILRERGYEQLLGNDLSENCARVAEQTYDVRVVPGPFLDFDESAGPFDCVIMAGVLEHLCDVHSVCAKARRLLVPGGRLFAQVPDAARFSPCHGTPFQQFTIEHINYFSPRTLEALWRRHGFELLAPNGARSEWLVGDVNPGFNAIYQKTPLNELPPLPRDEQSGRAIRAYVQESLATTEKVNAQIRQIISQTATGVVVWGTGTRTLRLLATSELQNAKIVLFVDINPRYHRLTLGGVPIVAPTDPRIGVFPIVISASLGARDEILHQIRNELRLSNKVIMLDT